MNELAYDHIGLVVNLAGMFLLRGHVGENLNARGAYLEVIKDLRGSAAVIVAAGIIMLTGWVWVDPAISALVGVFILPRTWLVLRERFKIGHVTLQVEGRDIDEDLLQSEH